MLAWRNVWRNRRRSLITMASMGFGLAAIMFGQSMVKSVQHQLVDKATGSITGHIQVQNRSIKDYKFPDRYVENPVPVEEAMRRQPGIFEFAKRITITGLVASPTTSLGSLIVAVETEKEKKITTIASHIVQGEFVGAGARGISMGDKMAQRLDLRVGEKVVVMAQADDGSMGAEAFRLTGIYHTGSASFDGQIVYVPLAGAQELLGTGAKVNNVVARVADMEKVDEIQQGLAEALSREPVQVLSWKQVDFEILAIQKFQNALLDMVLLVVFLIVALGILNTLLMSLFERVREFGVLMAIGAKPGWILRLVLLESLCLGVMGTLFGFTVGCLLIAHFGRVGLPLPVGDAFAYFLPFPNVLFLRYAWPSHLFAGTSVLVVSILAAIPPALRACRLRPAEALRHV